jgi:hypothetical protein
MMRSMTTAPFEPHTAVIQRNGKGQFLPGHIGIGGRKLGSRVKLGEAFIADLAETWEKHGAKALERCAVEEPAKFVQVCASLLPKDIDVRADINVSRAMDAVTAYRILRDMSDEERKRLREANTGD